MLRLNPGIPTCLVCPAVPRECLASPGLLLRLTGSSGKLTPVGLNQRFSGCSLGCRETLGGGGGRAGKPWSKFQMLFHEGWEWLTPPGSQRCPPRWSSPLRPPGWAVGAGARSPYGATEEPQATGWCASVGAGAQGWGQGWLHHSSWKWPGVGRKWPGLPASGRMTAAAGDKGLSLGREAGQSHRPLL